MRATQFFCLLALATVHGASSSCADGNDSQQCQSTAIDEAALVQKDMILKTPNDDKSPRTESKDGDHYKLQFGTQKVREFKDIGDGITIKTIHKGNGKVFPTAGEEIAVHYMGRLASTGKVFDSNEVDEAPFLFTYMVNRLIPGWEKALKVMSLGEKSEIYIPGAQGYGSRGALGIPADADLIFEVIIKGVGANSNTARGGHDATSNDIFAKNAAAAGNALTMNYTNVDVQNDWLTQEELEEHRAKGDEYGNKYAPAITTASNAVSKAMELQGDLYAKMDKIRQNPTEMQDVSERASVLSQDGADFVTDRRNREHRSKELYWAAGQQQKKYVSSHTDHDDVYTEATKENIFHHLLNGLEEGIHNCQYSNDESLACGIIVALPKDSGYSSLKGFAMPSESAPTNNIAAQVFKVDAMTLWYANYSRTDCCATYKMLFENKAVRYYETIFREGIPSTDGDESRAIGIQTAVKYYAGFAGLKKDELQSLLDKFNMPKAKAALEKAGEAAVVTTLKLIFEGQPTMKQVTDRMSEIFGDIYDDQKTSAASSHGLGLLAVALGIVASRL